MRQLDGKIALVTGAGKGIGRAVALRYASEGAQVIAAGPSESVDHVAAEAGNIVAYRCDARDPAQVEQMMAYCEVQFGRLDVLCVNAALHQSDGKRIHEMSLETWDAITALNQRGSFMVVRGGLQLMLKGGGGAIVVMSSIGGLHPVRGATAYTTSKAALTMLTRQIAIEYARDNIRANCICPGTILTPTVAAAGPDLIAMKESVTPMGRLGTSEEVAALALFLASAESAYTTGAIYPVAGGREAL